jgi:hypothetical protein
MNTAPITARAIRRTTAPVIIAASRFRWVARMGSLTAVTGQAGVLTRAGTAGSSDTNTTSYTAGHSMPRWESVNADVSTLVAAPLYALLQEDGSELLQEDGFALLLETGGARLALRCVTASPATDSVAWAVNVPVETATVLVDFVERATRTTSSAVLWYLGNDGQTGARLTVSSSGTDYQAILTDGTNTATIALATATPALGAAARLAVQLEVQGPVMRARLLLEILGTAGTTTTAWSSTIPTPASWGATTRFRLNRAGSGGTLGSTSFLQAAWVPGLVSLLDAGERL